MKFSEFVNRNKNVAQKCVSNRVADSIPIAEDRDNFFSGNLFKKYDMVESDGKLFRILEQCSNYYQVVDEFGTVARKFAKQLTLAPAAEILATESLFHGYELKSQTAKNILKENIASINKDDVGILKQIKEADKMEQYKSKDKLTVAKIIADAVGIPHDAISSPENLVNAAIRKAKKDPVLMKNKAILSNMLQIAKEVGIKYSDETFEIKESEPTAYWPKTPLTQQGDKRTMHKDEESFLKAAKELHGDGITSKWHHDSKPNDRKTYRTKDGKLIGHGAGDANNKNWNWALHSKHINEDISETIVKTDSGFELKSHTGKSLGKYATKEEAEKREKQVNYFKHVKESEQLDELSSNTLKTYSSLARENAAKLVKQGAKAKTLETGYSKMSKASKRLEGAAKADKKSFGKDWKAKIGMSEENEMYKDAAVIGDNIVGDTEAEEEVLHGHTMSGNRSYSYRHSLIKNLRGD